MCGGRRLLHPDGGGRVAARGEGAGEREEADGLVDGEVEGSVCGLGLGLEVCLDGEEGGPREGGPDGLEAVPDDEEDADEEDLVDDGLDVGLGAWRGLWQRRWRRGLCVCGGGDGGGRVGAPEVWGEEERAGGPGVHAGQALVRAGLGLWRGEDIELAGDIAEGVHGGAGEKVSTAGL